ncbi:MAG TPA: multicopper oxidase domain-containing protein [Casimicrobiaceae bacterium]
MPRQINRWTVLSFAIAGLALAWATAPASQVPARHYYIAAEDVVWDFAPSGKNLVHCMDMPVPCPIPAPWTNSHTFNKVRYIEYTDATFGTRKPQPEWLGALGPIIRAEEGDTVNVRFCNRSKTGASYGMHPHGLRYTKANEGAHYVGVNGGARPGAGSMVMPGECFDYSWIADADSAPGPGDLSSKVWWYHSHVDEPADTNLGLLGPIIVARRVWPSQTGARTTSIASSSRHS